MPPRHWIALPLSCLGIAAVLAADGAVDLGQSSIVATFRQQHAPVEAAFKKFSGSIVYDAARPKATVAALSVDMNSLDIGDADTEAEVRKPAWFDSAHYPQASFRATTITPGANGHFEASGPLTIKGKSQTITMAVSVQSSGRANAYDGSFELSRKAFGIGDPSWEGTLDDAVQVHFHLLVAGT
jgi:polyisoprenoid-binding protein YceI